MIGKALVSNCLRTTKARGYGSPLSAGTTPSALLARFRQQRQLPRLRLDLGLVGEMRGIGAGKTMVREFRIGGIAARLPHGAVHAVARQGPQPNPRPDFAPFLSI